MNNADWGILGLYYLLGRYSRLEEPGVLYGISPQEQETQELVNFVVRATQELQRRNTPMARLYGPAPTIIRISKGLRIYIGQQELKIRPMAKTVLLLFLRHPEGILLKCITDYKAELITYYRRLSRSQDPSAIDRCIDRILDIFSNDLNVNIARVNAAVGALVNDPIPYRIEGAPGQAKTILLDRSLVIWE